MTTKTKIVKITDPSLEEESVLEAADFLRKGELVAFPTETVYGLGGDGLSAEACRKIFETKGRPADNPLILHVSNQEQLLQLTEEIPDKVQELMDNLWPGPLTLVFKAKGSVPKVVTAGGDTVAVRMPSNPVALALIEKLGRPIAAPSANISGRPSPTKAYDVYEDMAGKIPMIIDGGESKIGIESTVLDLTEKPFKILRPGFYGREDFRPFVGNVVFDRGLIHEGVVPKSPGQKYKHYAPKAEVYCYRGEKSVRVKKIQEEILYWQKQGLRTGVLAFMENFDFYSADERLCLGTEKHYKLMARLLFQHLREMDRRKIKVVLVEGADEKGLGIGIMNRLRKACKGRVEDL